MWCEDNNNDGENDTKLKGTAFKGRVGLLVTLTAGIEVCGLRGFEFEIIGVIANTFVGVTDGLRYWVMGLLFGVATEAGSLYSEANDGV